MKTAILFGATGHIGSYLLQKLLDDSYYQRVTIVVRKPVRLQHTKLTVLTSNIDFLPQLQDQLVADEVFITLGASDPVIERKYPILAANLCHRNGATSIFVVTAAGANPTARMRYVRIKGEIEEEILSMDFKHTYFFRPGMIQDKREHYRPMEKTMMAIWRVIDPLFVGGLKKYKGMLARDIALAIYRAAQGPAITKAVYQWPEMKALVDAPRQKVTVL